MVRANDQGCNSRGRPNNALTNAGQRWRLLIGKSPIALFRPLMKLVEAKVCTAALLCCRLCARVLWRSVVDPELRLPHMFHAQPGLILGRHDINHLNE